MKITNFLKKYWKIITGVVGGALIIYITILIVTNRDAQVVKDLKKANKTLQVSYDSLFMLKQLNDRNIKMYENSITDLNNQVEQNIKVINQNVKENERLKKLSHEKITNVNSATARDLDSFFRARYPEGYNH